MPYQERYLMKKNCWEVKKCERQPGGQKVKEFGICPVTTYEALDGIHDGKNAGRACWVVAGTLCGGAVQGTEAQKSHNCWKCEFMLAVKEEETSEPAGFSLTHFSMGYVLAKKRGGVSADLTRC